LIKYSRVVVDANLAVHLVLDTNLSDLIDKAWTTWKQSGIQTVAPRLWHYEVTSAIHRVYFLGKIDEESAQVALKMVFMLGVKILDDDDLSLEAFNWATRLRRSAAYDCFYLALAQRLDTELWTADRPLSQAALQANAPWVKWIGEFK
jgi:predicted nucleic acid-binding protein